MGGLHNGASHEIAAAFARVLETVPHSFDFCDGSVGNLILSGRYLHEGEWARTLNWAHARLATCGYVFPISTARADLGARLANGRCVLGQAAITSRSTPIEAPIEELYLERDNGNGGESSRVQPDPSVHELRRAPWSTPGGLLHQHPALAAGRRRGRGDPRTRHAEGVAALNPVRDSEMQGKTPGRSGPRDRPLRLSQERQRPGNGKQVLRTGHSRDRSLSAERRELLSSVPTAEIEALGAEVIEIESPGLPGEGALERVTAELPRPGVTSHRVAAPLQPTATVSVSRPERSRRPGRLPVPPCRRLRSRRRSPKRA